MDVKEFDYELPEELIAQDPLEDRSASRLMVLMKIGDDKIEAARDLGANAFQTFVKVIFPMSMPGVISGITMVFVPSLTTFVISDLLGGSKILLIGNVIEQEFQQGSNWHVGSGLSLVLMIFIIASMALIAKYDKDGEGTAF